MGQHVADDLLCLARLHHIITLKALGLASKSELTEMSKLVQRNPIADVQLQQHTDHLDAVTRHTTRRRHTGRATATTKKSSRLFAKKGRA